jgi:HlyD family type I secretion membrane fusion protein
MTPPSSDFRRIARIGLIVVVLTFGVLGLWAAFAPLGAAVIGPGTIAIETNRKTIQHLEGGIVRKIHVREGDRVKAGQLLVELDPLQPTAGVEITRTQLFTLLARSDRLASERDGLASVRFSPEVLAQSADPIVRQAMNDEMRQFQERRATISGQVAILRSRAAQYREQISGIDRQKKAMLGQDRILEEELSGLRELYEKQLVPKPRLLALEREQQQISGQVGRLEADRAQAEKAIGESQLQAEQLQKEFQQSIAKELADIQAQTTELKEKYTVAQDVARRVNITSPVTGSVQGLRVFTEGAVIRGAEPIMDIVPAQGGFEIHAQFSPTDVDSLHPGMRTELRFPSFHQRNIPIVEGRIATVSQDRLVDEASKTAYFLVTIHLNEKDLPPALRGKLVAGMPAEVIVPTGSRTALEYIFNPLTNALRKAGREE